MSYDLPELPEDTAELMLSIKNTFQRIDSLPPNYDFQLPALVSHASDYSSDLPRLRRYAEQTISARIMQFGHITLYKTHYFIEMFLRGFSDENIYSMVFSARALVEVYAVTRDVFATISENAGDHKENYVARVRTIDETLITATYGTRLELVKELFTKLEVSKLREVNDSDTSLIQARNILTRIDRASKFEEYPDCRADYDRLSEYVHPNTGQNIILAWPSPKDSRLARLSRQSEYAFITAITASLRSIDTTSRAIVSYVLDGNLPFSGEMVYPSPPGT